MNSDKIWFMPFCSKLERHNKKGRFEIIGLMLIKKGDDCV